MQLSKKADYGLRLVLELARVYPDKKLATHEIARRQAVPEPFLAKIAAELARLGIIISQRGSGGGLILSRPPEEISILEVIEALDGPLTFTPCHDSPHLCCWAGQCVIENVLKEARDAMVAHLKSVSFADLVEADKKLRTVEIPVPSE